MTVFEYAGRLLIVDCGVLFPDPDQPGVDLILPDFGYLDGPARRRRGARAHPRATRTTSARCRTCSRQRPDIPLVGSQADPGPGRGASWPSTASSRSRSRWSRAASSSFGPFDCEFFAVNHSIPDALAVAIRTPAGVVLHTGDFKMDQLPLDGRLTDLAGFARLGGEGVDLLLSDSTNAEVPGFVTSRARHRAGARRDLRQRRAAHHRRLLRLARAPGAAGARRRGRRTGRKVAFVGRSMVRNMGIARDLGYLRVPGRAAGRAARGRGAAARARSC